MVDFESPPIDQQQSRVCPIMTGKTQQHAGKAQSRKRKSGGGSEQDVRPSMTHFLQKGLTSQRYHSLHQRHAIWGPSVQRREPMGGVSRSSHKSGQPLQGCAPNGLTSSQQVSPPKNSLTIAPQAGRKALGGLLDSTQTSYFSSSVLSSVEKYK